MWTHAELIRGSRVLNVRGVIPISAGLALSRPPACLALGTGLSVSLCLGMLLENSLESEVGGWVNEGNF